MKAQGCVAADQSELGGCAVPWLLSAMKRRDKRGCLRGGGHGKGVQHVALFAACVVKWFCFQALHTHGPVPP